MKNILVVGHMDHGKYTFALLAVAFASVPVHAMVSDCPVTTEITLAQKNNSELLVLDRKRSSEMMLLPYSDMVREEETILPRVKMIAVPGVMQNITHRNFKPVPFFTLLFVSFVFLPFQTSTEELLFRGYLMQGFGTLTKNRWFPLIITSVIFGLLHGMNPEVERLGYVLMIFYIGTGLLYGITTLMDEGTELALGLHASNNIVAAFLVTTDWMVFRTDALFIDTSEPAVGSEMFIGVFVLYPLLLVVFSKKYGWTNWKSKLFGKVEIPVINEE